MRKENLDDGATCYQDLFTDKDGWTWNVLRRKGGSVSVYATAPGLGGHAVVYDTLDNDPQNERAQAIISQICDLLDGWSGLIGAMETIKQASDAKADGEE